MLFFFNLLSVAAKAPTRLVVAPAPGAIHPHPYLDEHTASLCVRLLRTPPLATLRALGYPSFRDNTVFCNLFHTLPSQAQEGVQTSEAVLLEAGERAAIVGV